MIAADIRIDHTIIGTGDIILFAVLLAMLLVPVLFLAAYRIKEYVKAERRERRIAEAKLMPIGEGVCLAQGIMAYFGTIGHWAAPYENDGVCIMTGFSGYPRACLRAYPETGRIEALAFLREEPPAGKGEADILIETLIQAAKDKEGSRKT